MQITRAGCMNACIPLHLADGSQGAGHFVPLASVTEALRDRLAAGFQFLEKGKSSTVKDKSTAVEHPAEVCDLRNGKCAQLLGVGCAALTLQLFKLAYSLCHVHACFAQEVQQSHAAF